MFNTKCGCPYCRKQVQPHTHEGWKARKNKHNRFFGSCPKPGAKKGSLKHKKAH